MSDLIDAWRVSDGVYQDIPAHWVGTALGEPFTTVKPTYANAGCCGAVMEEPPRNGAGSGLAAWQAYADYLGIPVDGMSRDEIIAAVDAEGPDFETTDAPAPEDTTDTDAGTEPEKEN